MSALNEAERRAAVAALHAYRAETAHYLSGYDSPSQTHSPCCEFARIRDERRQVERELLRQRLRDIDGALTALGSEIDQ